MAFEATEFEAMMTSTVVVTPWSSFDMYGEPVFSSASSTYTCRLEAKPTVISNAQGDQIVAKTVLYISSTSALYATSRYVLADGSEPVVQHLERVYDNDGIHHHVLYLGGG